jgi:hypothetical protein
VRLWDSATGKEVRQMKLDDAIQAIAFTSDGKTIVTGSADRTIQFWDRATLKNGKTIIDQRYPVGALALSPDGLALASTGIEDKKVRLWGIPDGKELAELTGHDDDVEDILFSPRGQMVVSAGRDGTIRIWELTSNKERGALRGHLAEVNRLVCSRDGSVLLSLSRDGTALAWNLFGPAHGEKVPMPLEKNDLDSLWDNLGLVSAPAAFKAIVALQRAPDQAIPYLKGRVKPVSRQIGERIKKLIQDMDSDEFEIRESATKELTTLGSIAVAPLREALKENKSLEFTRRAEQVLAKIDVPGISVEQLQVLRAVEVLELIGDKAAREHLKQLAEGMAESPLTREARAALARLSRRDSDSR